MVCVLYRLGVEQAKEEHKLAVDEQMTVTHNQIEVHYTLHIIYGVCTNTQHKVVNYCFTFCIHIIYKLLLLDKWLDTLLCILHLRTYREDRK